MNVTEFAKAIGVSVTTVSHAISGRRYVRPETREMILQKMHELGYTPNQNARRLVKGRSYQVELVYVNSDALIDPDAMNLANAVIQDLRVVGYSVLLNVMTSSRVDFNALLSHVKSSTVDGTIIVGGGRLQREWLGEIAEWKHPCVLIDDMAVEARPYVGATLVDYGRGVSQIAGLLRENGHRRVGIIHRGLDESLLVSLLAALDAEGIRPLDEHMVYSGQMTEDSYHCMRSLMSHPEPPTAVFARTDYLALGAMYSARDMGLSIPRDVSIVGHDDMPIAAIAYPPLTTVRVDMRRLSKLTVDALLAAVDDENGAMPVQFVETELTVRGSVGPAPVR